MNGEAMAEEIAISACEQSGRNLLPKIHQLTPLDKAINEVTASTRLVLDPGARQGLKLGGRRSRTKDSNRFTP